MRSMLLARWVMPALLRRYRVASIIAIVGVAIFGLTLTVLGAQASTVSSDKNGLASDALKAVDVASYGSGQNPRSITTSSLRALKALPHVAAAHAWASTDVSLLLSGGAVTLSYVTRIPSVQAAIATGTEPQGSQLALPKSMMKSKHLRVGDTVTIEHIKSDGSEGEGVDTKSVISGFYDDSRVGLDGPGVIYGSTDAVLTDLGASRGHSLAWMTQNYVFPRAFVIADSTSTVNGVAKEALSHGYGATSLSALVTAIPATQLFVQGLKSVLLGLLVLFLIVVAASLGSSVFASRKSEIGLLRAIGWLRREIFASFVVQFAVLGLIVGIVGMGLGALTLAVLSAVARTATVIGISLSPSLGLQGWLTLLVLALAPAVIFVVITGIPIARLARIAPDDVLRDL